MSRGVLPTEALTPDDVPGPEAEARDVIRFATSLYGYEAVGMEGVKEAASALGADGPEALDLHGLRTALFALQRAHYVGGEYADDGSLEEMREITAEIKRRVETQTPSVAVWHGDITTLAVDAIVNAANETLLGGGGVDGAIHRAAGPELLAACRALPEVVPNVRCPTGEARITPGFALPARLVVHTVGPRWRNGTAAESHLLDAAYRQSLALATAEGARTVAFPAISTGVFGFPADRAAEIAARATTEWAAGHDLPLRILLVAFDPEAERILRGALEQVAR